MELFLEIVKFIIYSSIIVLVSKLVLVKLLRKIAEILDLSPKAVGNVAGFATSMPELLTVFFSSLQGLYGTSMYNIISSNVINFVQYIWSIIINKNVKVLRNRALKIELSMCIATIIIPIAMIAVGMEANLTIVPILLGVGVILFIVGNWLGDTLDTLSNAFNIPQAIIGIILGFVTSIPELITFIEAQRHHSKNTNDTQGVIEATSNLFASNMLNLFVIESIGIITYIIVS